MTYRGKDLNQSGALVQNRHRGTGRKLLLGIGLALAAQPVLAVPTLAADTTQTTGSQRAEKKLSLHLPAQDLNDALLSFARTAGLQLVYDVTLVQGRTSAALDGEMSAQEGLSRLLSGSGLTYRFVAPGTVALETMPTNGAMTIAPVTVTGTTSGPVENAYGPVSGYVARRSATATKTDTSILEIPRSVSVVTGEELSQRQPTSISESLGYVAGVEAAARGGDDRYDWFTIRGFDASSSLYRDGLNAQGTDGKIEPYALERIEVLKGPASILFGQVAPGGIVNAVTKRPSQDSFGEVETQLGTNNHIEGRADINAPLTNDKTVAARMVLLKKSSDTSVKYSPDDRDYALMSLGWTPTDTTNLTVMGDYRHDKTSFPPGLPAEGTAWASRFGKISQDFFVGSPDLESLERTQYSLGYAFEHKFTNQLSFTQNARTSVADTPDFFGVRAGSILADGRTLTRRNFAGKTYRGTNEIDSQVHLKGDTGPVQHHLIAGLDYMHNRYIFNYGMSAAPSIDLYDPVYQNGVYNRPASTYSSVARTTQTGVYLQDQAKIADRWTLTLGARRDLATVKNTDSTGTYSRQDDNAVTWNAGLVYQFDNGIAPYASYATSFLPNSGTDSSGHSFNPSTAQQGEVGVKYQPPGRDSMITLSAFDLVQDHVLTADPADTNFQVDAGQWESKGFELENRLALGYGFRLISAATLMDVKIKKSNDGNQGRRPAGVANQMLSTWLDYEVKTGDLQGLGMGAGVRYVGDRPVDSSSVGTAPGYAVADLSLRYQLDSLGFGLSATNLFDTAYVQCRDATTCAWGQGRSVIGSIKYRW